MRSDRAQALPRFESLVSLLFVLDVKVFDIIPITTISMHSALIQDIG